jgi:hypothetical protein
MKLPHGGVVDLYLWVRHQMQGPCGGDLSLEWLDVVGTLDTLRHHQSTSL